MIRHRRLQSAQEQKAVNGAASLFAAGMCHQDFIGCAAGGPAAGVLRDSGLKGGDQPRKSGGDFPKGGGCLRLADGKV